MIILNLEKKIVEII